MQLNVVTVTLNIDTVTFLGISIVGQTCTRGDNGIYVADVMPGGAVALDGRIEPGDMILQVAKFLLLRLLFEDVFSIFCRENKNFLTF